MMLIHIGTIVKCDIYSVHGMLDLWLICDVEFILKQSPSVMAPVDVFFIMLLLGSQCSSN